MEVARVAHLSLVAVAEDDLNLEHHQKALHIEGLFLV